VATDVAARGIDVPSITHVINHGLPMKAEDYTHRIGRTGRAEATGEAVTFAVQDDEPLVRDIERVLGKPIERRRLEGFDYGSFAPESQRPAPKKSLYRSRGFRGQERGGLPAQSRR